MQSGVPSPSLSMSATPQPQLPGAVLLGSFGQPSSWSHTPSPSLSGLSVKLAAPEVAIPQLLVTTTSYEPAAPALTGLIVKVSVVAPETFPPLLSSAPPL